MPSFVLLFWIQHINPRMFSPARRPSQHPDLNNSNRLFIGKCIESNLHDEIKLFPVWCIVYVALRLLFTSLSVQFFLSRLSFRCFLSWLSLSHCTLTNIHPFSSSYLFIIKRKWIFFLWLLLVKAPSLVLLPQANQGRIWSDLFIFLNFIHPVVRFPLACLSGKQYEMGTEKYPAAGAACAWRTQNEVMRNARLGQCVIGCSNTMCFLTPGSLSTLLTFSLHSYDWYAFLILFSLGLNPPRPS